MSPKALKDAIRQKAGELGFELVGMVPVQPSNTHEIYKAWLEKGYAGEMAYLERHLPLKQDPRNLLPEALSLVALAFNYYTGDHPESDGSKGKISRYAWSEDYHQIMHERLKQLSDFILVELGLGTKSRGLVDSGPILEREYAWRAGLGWFGKHSNLIHWKKGSWFFLTELLIDLPLEADQPFTRVDCGTCTRCIEACPTEAIVADREVDSRLCISYLTIELKGSIPRNLRPKMGNWIFGCDICQEVCPWNGKAPLSMEKGFAAEDSARTPDLGKLMELNQSEFRKRFKNSPVLRTKRRGLLRNVAIALGNWGNPQAIPALEQGLLDQEPLIRSHSAWGLGQVATNKAYDILENALTSEEDPQVLEEIREALSAFKEKTDPIL
ncbi:MAG: tRNA epoxyqueuosine(34) reductase QueG [bacterium]